MNVDIMAEMVHGQVLGTRDVAAPGWPAKKHLSLSQAVRRLDKRQRSLMCH